MADKNINIKISSKADDSGFGSAMGWINQIRGGIGLLAGTSVFGGLTTAFNAIVGFGKVAVAAFAQAQDGEKRLESALINGGDNAGRYMKAFKALAESLQETTRYGDDEIIMHMSLMRNIGIGAEKIGEYSKAAVGLASKLRVDLGTAFTMIIKASGGQFTALERLGLKFKGTDAEKFASILKFATAGLKNAEADIKTLSGSQEQLNNTWHRSKIEIGAYLAELLKIPEATKAANKVLQKVNESPLIKSTIAQGVKGMVISGLTSLGSALLPASGMRAMQLYNAVSSPGSILGSATAGMKGEIPSLPNLRMRSLSEAMGYATTLPTRSLSPQEQLNVWIAEAQKQTAALEAIKTNTADIKAN